MSEWRMFKRSIYNHPGLLVGYIWGGMVTIALLQRPGALTWRHVVVGVVLALLPWIAILITAWTGRKEYAEEEE